MPLVGTPTFYGLSHEKSYVLKDLTQSGSGGSPVLSDITRAMPTAASTIHSTAAQMPSLSDNGPMKNSISIASARTPLPIQKL